MFILFISSPLPSQFQPQSQPQSQEQPLQHQTNPKIEPDPELLSQLMEIFQFPEDKCKKALILSNNDMDIATDMLCNNVELNLPNV